MARFRTQFSDSVKKRTVESPKGPYKVCLEGYFDFNEALVKLMILQGDMLPRASQYEPEADSDNDSDMDFVEPQFDDVCDALELSGQLADKFNRPLEPVNASQAKVKGNGEGEPSPKPPKDSTDPVSEVVD